MDFSGNSSSSTAMKAGKAMYWVLIAFIAIYVISAVYYMYVPSTGDQMVAMATANRGLLGVGVIVLLLGIGIAVYKSSATKSNGSYSSM